jgi:hypothetical protein
MIFHTDVSGQPIGLIFKAQALQEELHRGGSLKSSVFV